MHSLHLSLGSNIEPEQNLRRAVALLRERSEVLALSRVWQSHAVGSPGPDFLNLCAWVRTPLTAAAFKAQVIQPIEAALGRQRSADRFAPRTIDIDPILEDGQPWGEVTRQAFVIVPLAELAPDLHYPPDAPYSLAELAARLRAETWIVARPEVEIG
jgi:2-amino-4-hydroxy-6-hydroxymethyldihydropteridine diphosphokinase